MRVTAIIIAAAVVLGGCQNHVDPGNPAPAACDPNRGDCPQGTPNTGVPPTTTPTNVPPTNAPPNPPAHR